ncbi:MAG TPA: hypothetical protein VNE58_13225 [Casimicrobiaceae bacterium]|nr:hypothetical protein [Casimicrobiaceae bacterium]
MRARQQFLAALALSIVSTVATAAPPCAGFDDVDSNDIFCANIEWIRNRGVTIGCNIPGTLYCPTQPVLRNQMAAFMNRLGTALTPVQVGVDVVSGAVNLSGAPTICQTANYAVTGFPRRAYLDLAFAGLAPTNVDVAADLVYTTDNGANWTQLTTVANRGAIAANQWGSIANLANVDLAVGQTVRFGVRMSRVAGSGDLSDSRCNLRASIISRDGTASPF